MARLLYTCLASLDGVVVDAGGRFDWAAPDEEVHAHVNAHERTVGTHLYGRRLYEVMSAWETLSGPSEVERDYGEVWRAADKVVVSRTLPEVTTRRTTLVRALDPDAVRRLLAESDRDVSVGGPGLAGAALRAGLVDEVAQYLFPVAVGGGTRVFPDGLRLDLELLEERRFTSGVVLLRHRVRR